tara:strand:+ start:4337 stop:4831 length:495 start_codon:yes stop_codon:yes gene_type:complete
MSDQYPAIDFDCAVKRVVFASPSSPYGERAVPGAGVWAVFEPGDCTRYDVSLRELPREVARFLHWGPDDRVFELSWINGPDGQKGPHYFQAWPGTPFTEFDLERVTNEPAKRALLAFATHFADDIIAKAVNPRPNPWARSYPEGVVYAIRTGRGAAVAWSSSST